MAYLRQVLIELQQILHHNEELASQVEETQKEIKDLRRALQELTNDHVRTVGHLEEELTATKEALRVAQRAVEREEARAKRAVEETRQRAPAPAPAQVDDGVETAMRDALRTRDLEEIIEAFHLRNEACPVQ